MPNTPEQTLSDLLALGEKATEGEWFVSGRKILALDHDEPDDPWHVASAEPNCGYSGNQGAPNAAFIAAAMNALPAIREYMEVAEAARGLLNNFDELDRMTNVEEIERLESALSRLEGRVMEIPE